jgi:hypothetical protein
VTTSPAENLPARSNLLVNRRIGPRILRPVQAGGGHNWILKGLGDDGQSLRRPKAAAFSPPVVAGELSGSAFFEGIRICRSPARQLSGLLISVNLPLQSNSRLLALERVQISGYYWSPM